VKDNGIGIDPSQHRRVFDLFYKINKKSEGTGAGLAIAKRIIEVHGGRIWIESQEGQGCTVWFALPLARNSADCSMTTTQLIITQLIVTVIICTLQAYPQCNLLAHVSAKGVE
jgi:hypothetical protein